MSDNIREASYTYKLEFGVVDIVQGFEVVGIVTGFGVVGTVRGIAVLGKVVGRGYCEGYCEQYCQFGGRFNGMFELLDISPCPSSPLSKLTIRFHLMQTPTCNQKIISFSF